MGARVSYEREKNNYPQSYKQIVKTQVKNLNHRNKEVQFNYNSTILLVNQGVSCHIFQIKSQTLKVFVIRRSSIYISQMMCFKKSNTFISGSLNKEVAIQSLIALNNRKIISKQIIPVEVSCIIINNAENQIIVGGYQKISILQIENGIKVHQNLQICNDWITNLSINEFDTYLAITSNENYVLLMEQITAGNQKIWIQKQMIKIFTNQCYPIFINNNNLIIKPINKELFQVYQYNLLNGLFEYLKEVQLKGNSHKFQVAPLLFNEKLQVLGIINQHNVNIIKIINKNDFEYQQTIISQSETIRGKFSLNGRYFALLIQKNNQLLLFKLM